MRTSSSQAGGVWSTLGVSVEPPTRSGLELSRREMVKSNGPPSVVTVVASSPEYISIRPFETIVTATKTQRWSALMAGEYLPWPWPELPNDSLTPKNSETLLAEMGELSIGWRSDSSQPPVPDGALNRS